MKKKTMAIICVITILLIPLIAVVNREIPIRYIFSAERIRAYEIAVMRESRLLNEASVTLTSDDVTVQFPLPNGAVPFENNEYPVREGDSQFLVTTEAFEHYIYTMLPRYGFETEQLGSWFKVRNSNNSIRVGISRYMFTRNYMRIVVAPFPFP